MLRAMSEPKPARIQRAAEITAQSQSFTHPWNPNSEMHGAQLGRPGGLVRSGINVIRVPAGKEAFTFHAHLHEEEWIYILSGRALLDLGDESHELGAGDFVAFPTPSQPHQLRNPFDADVVYLTGGESADFDVADYPRLGKRMVRVGMRATVYDLETGQPFPYPEVERL
jgi:uncharacterized cupin superfamily protein